MDGALWGATVTARAWLGLVLVILACGATASVWLRCEGDAPELRGPEQLHIGRAAAEIGVEAIDVGSGVRGLELRVKQGDLVRTLGQRSVPGNVVMGGNRGVTERIEASIDSKGEGLREGDARLIVTATDWSWRDWFAGNGAELEIPIRIDLTRPRISVETGLTYVQRGGAGAVVYRSPEPLARDGVQVGDAFFASRPFPGDPKRRIVLFAIPRDTPPSPRITAVAEDPAGNEASAGWPVNLKERKFDDVRIELGSTFLESKVRELAEDVEVKEDDPIKAFQIINRDVRAKNERQIREIVAESGDEPLFDGAFVQMRNSAVTSRFAEHRTYHHAGEKISEAIHFGYDLASTAGAPIEASNRGRVLFAGPLGIYGDCVILDHGLGLTSLYGHLSQIDVAKGDLVEKGGVLGRSGATGLAGGDHLHFAILVGDAYVDPTEWWDAKWVREKVMSRLGSGEDAADTAASAPTAR
jgi:murein DD-endopeptidase MepM/ murein hydrolase activator NlpD